MPKLRRFTVALSAAVLASCDWGSGGGDTSSDSASQSTTIYAFGGSSALPNDGAEPKGSLTLVAVNGKPVLFGRTAIGGNATGDSADCGIIFSIHPDGSNYQVLYRFNGPDGCDPRHDAMTFDPGTGVLYSTTQGLNQGTNQTYGNQGQIVAFSPASTIPVPIPAIRVFYDVPDAGAQQHSSFSIDPQTGMLYGQTAKGGTRDGGLLYAISPDGSTFVPLHNFTEDEGSNPHGRIVLDNGVLYGIARSNGTVPADAAGHKASGHGAIYAFTLTTPLASGPITVLHTFAGGPDDGALSDHGYLTPVTDSHGKRIFYGLTQCGGTGSGADACASKDGGGDGVIFQIDPSAAADGRGGFSIVHSFKGKENDDGADPYGSLMFDGTYLYGTTSLGGKHDQGTVFRIKPPDRFGDTAEPEILYHFGDHHDDGHKPIDNVVEYCHVLYGMTVYGGASGPSPDDTSETGRGAIFAIPNPSRSSEDAAACRGAPPPI